MQLAAVHIDKEDTAVSQEIVIRKLLLFHRQKISFRMHRKEGIAPAIFENLKLIFCHAYGIFYFQLLIQSQIIHLYLFAAGNEKFLHVALIARDTAKSLVQGKDFLILL